jgi:hypothetical protein
MKGKGFPKPLAHKHLWHPAFFFFAWLGEQGKGRGSHDHAREHAAGEQ